MIHMPIKGNKGNNNNKKTFKIEEKATKIDVIITKMQLKQIMLGLTIGGAGNEQLELAGVNTCKAAEKV